MFHNFPKLFSSLYILPKGILTRCLGLALGKMWGMCILEIGFYSKNASGPPAGVPGTSRWVPGCGTADVPEACPDICIKGQRVGKSGSIIGLIDSDEYESRGSMLASSASHLRLCLAGLIPSYIGCITTTYKPARVN